MNSSVSTASASIAAFWLGVRIGGGFMEERGGGVIGTVYAVSLLLLGCLKGDPRLLDLPCTRGCPEAFSPEELNAS